MIWNYKDKTLLHTIEQHENMVYTVLFHPEMPLIFSGSEDGIVYVWNRNTTKVQSNLNYYMQKVWTLACSSSQPSNVAIGYDEGTIVIKLTSDSKTISLNNGKIIYANGYEIFGYN